MTTLRQSELVNESRAIARDILTHVNYLQASLDISYHLKTVTLSDLRYRTFIIDQIDELNKTYNTITKRIDRYAKDVRK